MSITVPSSPADQKTIKDAIQQIVVSLQKQDFEKENIKSITDLMKDKFDIPPALIKSAAKLIHTSKKQDADEKFDDIDTLYDIATKKLS